MKLKQFTPEVCISERLSGTKPAIGITRKGGLFRINKGACDLMDLTEADQVLFHQDEEDPECWYIEKVKKGGFELRKKDNITSGLLFSNTKLTAEIFNSLSYEGKGGKVLLAGQPTTFEKRKLYGLLTIGLKNQ